MSSSFSSTKPSDRDQILRLCQRRVGCRVAPHDLELVRITSDVLTERVASIVSRNLASGRAGRAMTGRTTDDLEEPALQAYVDRVIACYLQEHRRVERLAAKTGGEWNRLYEQLTRRAWYVLQGYVVCPARAADDAQDLAQETCEAIFCCRFPYDVPFDAWATRILLNCVLYYRTRSKGLMDRQLGIGSLDRPGFRRGDHGFSMYELLSDESGTSAFERLEERVWLLQVVGCLDSREQQQVIVDKYFYELKDEEIARRIGKTRQAVWNLRRRALQNLRKMLV